MAKLNVSRQGYLLPPQTPGEPCEPSEDLGRGLLAQHLLVICLAVAIDGRGVGPDMGQVLEARAEGGRDGVWAGVTGACALFRGGNCGRDAGWDGVFIIILQEGCLRDIWGKVVQELA